MISRRGFIKTAVGAAMATAVPLPALPEPFTITRNAGYEVVAPNPGMSAVFKEAPDIGVKVTFEDGCYWWSANPAYALQFMNDELLFKKYNAHLPEIRRRIEAML